MNRTAKNASANCVCTSGKKYTACCKNILNDPHHEAFATTITSAPVADCFASDTLDQGITNIFVVRALPNDTFTVGIYLVDLLCLGIKNAHTEVDVDQDFINGQKMMLGMMGMEMAEIDYEDVRTLVLGSVAYAAQFGFKPHPDFMVAQHIIEPGRSFEDSFLFGEEGKPVYIPGPADEELHLNREDVERIVIAAGGRVVHFSAEDLEDDEDECDDEACEHDHDEASDEDEVA
jgi:hypothetical protein